MIMCTILFVITIVVMVTVVKMVNVTMTVIMGIAAMMIVATISVVMMNVVITKVLSKPLTSHISCSVGMKMETMRMTPEKSMHPGRGTDRNIGFQFSNLRVPAVVPP